MRTITMMALCLAMTACANTNWGNRQASTSDNARTSVSDSSNWDGVVVAVEPASAMDAGATGAGAIGAAAAGGTMQKGYRVTLRKDDGSMQTVMVDAQPSYQVGDKVSYRNGQVMTRGSSSSSNY